MLNNMIKSNKLLMECFSKKLKQSLRKINSAAIKNSFGDYDIVTPKFVSRHQEVPAHIPKPSYYESGVPEIKSLTIDIKNEDEIKNMRKSCRMAAQILKNISPLIKPGITTDFIDKSVHEMIIKNGAYPSPLNYHGFPKSICTSVNNVACHGIPDDRPLQEGDILNVDITVYLNGFHGDCSKMFTVGQVDSEAKRLIAVTENCLTAGINVCKAGEKFSSIGCVIDQIARENGFSVIPAFAGHGIGRYFHGLPDILHFANDYPEKMSSGMIFTIEPVLSQGGCEIEILEDGWTAVTTDNARTAQIEHTILINNKGCEILTL